MSIEQVRFATGKGSADTRTKEIIDRRTGKQKPNPHISAGKPYDAISFNEIVELAKAPRKVEKRNAQWAIFSTYCDFDARVHSVQRERGEFWVLPVDLDKDAPNISGVASAIQKALGGIECLVYASRSATEAVPKWRVLVPLVEAVRGSDYAEIQRALFDLLEEQGLTCDRALERTGQLVFLPNKGDYYVCEHIQGERLNISDGAIWARVQANKTADEKAKSLSAQAMVKRRAKVWEDSADRTPTHWFNSHNSLVGLMLQYGYEQRGNSVHWRSPHQSSGSFATMVVDERWVSLSCSDRDEGLGHVAESGTVFGDTYDLFVHFECDGNHGKAWREIRKRMPKQSLAVSVETEIDCENVNRSYEELMAAISEISPAHTDAISAITRESVTLDNIQRDAICRALKDETGIPLGVLRSQIASNTPSAEAPDHLALANGIVSDIGPENILHAEQFVWQWSDTGLWRKLEERETKQLVQNAISARVEITASTVGSVTDVLKSAIYRPDHQFNVGDPETVNCTNGELVLYEFLGSDLEPHKREHYSTTQIPVAFDETATAPRFENFLEEVFRDDLDKYEKRRALLEMIGYTLMSHARHEKFIMLIGAGANGKSVLLSVLETLLGRENVAGVQPSNFDHSFQRAHLHMKLANIVTELKQGEVIADAELKAITSGEPATVEHKFKDPFVMRPFSTCWFGTNHMPHTRDFSDALFRRAVIITFNRVFAKEEQNPRLKDDLTKELPGILNLAIDAYSDALISGFTTPTSSEKAKQEWQLEADQVAQFVEDQCVRSAEDEVAAQRLFQDYKAWAELQGVNRTVSQKTFRDRLSRLGFGSRRTSKSRFVTGLKLKDYCGDTDIYDDFKDVAF